jgi:coenzyme F420 hydrogenase subunit beta
MANKNFIRGQKELIAEVQDAGLCTGCGACVNLCPYYATSKDKTVVKDVCDRTAGRCYAFCPRTPTDLESIRQQLFDPQDLTPELGAVKGFYLTRASDPGIRSIAQHGGTVTTLMSLALAEGIIDTALLAEGGGATLPRGVAVSDASEVPKLAKSKFIAAPMVEAFNLAAQSKAQKIGIVATPCQTLALAKMKMKPFPKNDSQIGKLSLTIGLFCGWVLSWRSFKQLLDQKVHEKAVVSLDIPPSKYKTMQVETTSGLVDIPLEKVEACVREACKFCTDVTAEFSDISVGSARLPDGWEVAKGWNQVIVRTAAGEALMQLAKDRQVLEFREVPDGNLEKLKQASVNKKKTALDNLACKSGDRDDLLYLDCRDPVFQTFDW